MSWLLGFKPLVSGLSGLGIRRGSITGCQRLWILNISWQLSRSFRKRNSSNLIQRKQWNVNLGSFSLSVGVLGYQISAPSDSLLFFILSLFAGANIIFIFASIKKLLFFDVTRIIKFWCHFIPQVTVLVWLLVLSVCLYPWLRVFKAISVFPHRRALFTSHEFIKAVDREIFVVSLIWRQSLDGRLSIFDPLLNIFWQIWSFLVNLVVQSLVRLNSALI